MTPTSRPAHLGMRHVALNVRDMAAAEDFYVRVMGMAVEWRADPQNLYLTSGGDNVALHQADAALPRDEASQRLDHIGFFVGQPDEVDAWAEWLRTNGVRIRTPPRTHRDGARSLYCYDPDGTVVQIICHPPVAAQEQASAR
ncbi:MAG: VOC family protein [Gammaproteobacteria bacterium]|nr:VOC family protein [Gammaproteobacteria bacterium]